jgi:hypothetical protein
MEFRGIRLTAVELHKAGFQSSKWNTERNSVVTLFFCKAIWVNFSSNACERWTHIRLLSPVALHLKEFCSLVWNFAVRTKKSYWVLTCFKRIVVRTCIYNSREVILKFIEENSKTLGRVSGAVRHKLRGITSRASMKWGQVKFSCPH